MVDQNPHSASGPLRDLDQWEDELRRRYPESANELAPGSTKAKDQFRDYRAEAPRSVHQECHASGHRQAAGVLRASLGRILAPAIGVLAKRKRGVHQASVSRPLCGQRRLNSEHKPYPKSERPRSIRVDGIGFSGISSVYRLQQGLSSTGHAHQPPVAACPL